jgi:hypothetical protein
MYSPEIYLRTKKAGLKFKRLPRDRSMEISQSLELLRYTSRRERPLGAIVAGSNFSRTGIYPVREDPLPGLTPLDLICQRFIAYAILEYG